MGLLGGHAPLTASQPVPDAAGYIVKVGDTAPDFETEADGRTQGEIDQNLRER